MFGIGKEERFKDKFIQLVDYLTIYLRWMHKLEDHKITLIEDKKFEIFQSFTRIDIDNKGYLNNEDIENFLMDNKHKIWTFDAKLFIDSLNDDSKAVLEYNEFSRFLLPGLQFNKDYARRLSNRPIRSLGGQKVLKPNLEILLSDLIAKHIEFEKDVIGKLKELRMGIEEFREEMFTSIDFEKEGYIDIKKFFDFLILNEITEDQEDAVQLFKTLIAVKERRKLTIENFFDFLYKKKNININFDFEKKRERVRIDDDSSHLFGLSYDIADEISIIKAKKDDTRTNTKLIPSIMRTPISKGISKEPEFEELKKSICKDFNVLSKRFESEEGKLHPYHSIKRSASRSKEGFKKPPLSSKSPASKSLANGKRCSRRSLNSSGEKIQLRKSEQEPIKPFGSPVYKLMNTEGYNACDHTFSGDKRDDFDSQGNSGHKIFQNIQIPTSRTNDFDDMYDNDLEDFPVDSPPGAKITVDISDFCVDTTNEFKGFYEVDEDELQTSGKKPKKFDYKKLEILDSEYEEITSDSELGDSQLATDRTNRDEEEGPMTFNNNRNKSQDRIEKFRKYFEEGRDISYDATISDFEITKNSALHNLNKENQEYEIYYQSKQSDFDTLKFGRNNRPHKVSVDTTCSMERTNDSGYKRRTGREADILKIRLVESPSQDKYNYNSKNQSYYNKPIMEEREESDRNQDKENMKDFANVFESFKANFTEKIKRKSKPFEIASKNREVFREIVNSKQTTQRVVLKEIFEDFLIIEKELEKVRCGLANSKDFNVAVLYEYLDKEFKGFARREELADFTKIVGCDFNLNVFNKFADNNFGTNSNSISFQKFSQVFYPSSSQSFEKMRQKMYSENSRTRFDKFTKFTLINLQALFNLLFDLSKCTEDLNIGFSEEETTNFFFDLSSEKNHLTVFDLLKYRDYMGYPNSTKKKLFEKISFGRPQITLKDFKYFLG